MIRQPPQTTTTGGFVPNMRTKSWTALLLAATALSVAASGADSPRMTLAECIHFGLEHGTSARRARIGQRIAETEIRQARSLALPHLSLNASYTRPDEVQHLEWNDESIALGPENRVDVTAGITQTLYAGGQVAAALRAADLTQAHAEAQRQSIEAELVRDIEVQFFGVLLAEEAVAVQTASIAQLEAYARQTADRLENAAASEFDLLTARVRLANEIPRLVEARNRRDLARTAFRTLLNYPGEFALEGRLDVESVDFPLQSAEALALENRPELRVGEIRVGLGREAIQSARSEGRPSIKGFFNYRGSNATSFGEPESGLDWNWEAGLTLSWNLWDGDLTRQTVQRKRLEMEQYGILLDALRSAVLLEVRQAVLNLSHARDILQSSQETVTLAEAALEIARERHAAGLATYLEFTDANLALSTARLAHAKAHHDHAVAMAQVRFSCGLPSP